MPCRSTPALIVTKKPLSEILGVTTRTIERLMTHGMPCDRNGRAIRFDLHEVVPWYIQYRAKASTYRNQVDAARARKLRLETDILASKLVHAEVF